MPSEANDNKRIHYADAHLAAKQDTSPERHERRRSVTAAFCVIWLLMCLGLFARFGSRGPSGVAPAMAGLASLPSIVLVTVILYVVGSWVRDQPSLSEFWRLMRRSQSLHKATFDYLKNTAVPIAAVATVGRGLGFLLSGGMAKLPDAVKAMLPPGAYFILCVATVAMYFACVALVLGAMFQANLAVRQAADDYLKERLSHRLKKDQKISPIVRRYFRRRVGAQTYVSILIFVTILVFGFAFLYALFGNSTTPSPVKSALHRECLSPSTLSRASPPACGHAFIDPS